MTAPAQKQPAPAAEGGLNLQAKAELLELLELLLSATHDGIVDWDLQAGELDDSLPSSQARSGGRT